MATKKIIVEIEIPVISANSDAFEEIKENKRAKDYFDKLTNIKAIELRDYMISWLTEFAKEWFNKFPKEQLNVLLNQLDDEKITLSPNKDINITVNNLQIIYNYAVNTWITMPRVCDVQTLAENWNLIKQSCKNSMDTKLQQLYNKSADDLGKAQERFTIIHELYKDIMKGCEN